MYVLLIVVSPFIPFLLIIVFLIGIFKLFLQNNIDIAIQFRRVCIDNKYAIISVETIGQSIPDDNINGPFSLYQY